MRVKRDDEMQTSKSFAQSQNMTSLSGISQKTRLSTQMMMSTNLSLKRFTRKHFSLTPSPS